MSSKPASSAKCLQNAGYFGRMLESPPGLPGGGITGVLPVSGVGARISGSTPDGGHNTPSERASLSPSGSARWPVVVPSGATVPRGGAGCIGEQSLARTGAGGAVWAGGVAGVGGACALATPDAASNTHARKSRGFFLMPGERSAGAEVPAGTRKIVRLCGTGSAKNVPSAASGGARSG
jgi:hypothetical protein